MGLMIAKVAGAIILVLILALVGFVATRPDSFEIQRSATIDAPPAVVFGFLNDFHEWGHWSPWEKLDPDMTRTYEGAAAGTGAAYRWAGDNTIGEGSMTMTESKPNESLTIQLNFVKPFKANNTVYFTLTPSGTGTTVTWRMAGKNTLMGKVMSLFMSMDTMVGGSMEEGLANLDAAAKAKQG